MPARLAKVEFEFAYMLSKTKHSAANLSMQGVVGLVPTMGGFHEGHLSLVRSARAECRVVVVSIFVNPLQFGRDEDFELYPRREASDTMAAEKERVDVLLIPGVDEMYPGGMPDVEPDPGPIGDRLEGAFRPGHFRGVLTAVARLFALARPGKAYFGEKDAQQLFLVRKMAEEMYPSIEIVACPTVREPDGLAMSSRNAYLSPQDRRAATCLYRALRAAAKLHLAGERDANVLKAEMAKHVGAEPLAKLGYVAIVDETTFEEVVTLDRPARALVAARFGTTRLIDNLLLGS